MRRELRKRNRRIHVLSPGTLVQSDVRSRDKDRNKEGMKREHRTCSPRILIIIVAPENVLILCQKWVNFLTFLSHYRLFPPYKVEIWSPRLFLAFPPPLSRSLFLSRSLARFLSVFDKSCPKLFTKPLVFGTLYLSDVAQVHCKIYAYIFEFI